MKLLVTGGAGFIGSNFILYWMKNHPQDSIVNLDKLTYAGNLENLREVENNPRYSFIKGDICDAAIVNRAMEGVEVVVHFAAESHVDRSIAGPAVFVMTNVVGTQVLLDNALKHRIKHFHHVSTDEVYGSLTLTDSNKFNERTIYNPRSPYSASKAGSDYLVNAYHATYGLPITITNCSNNFGPYQFPEKLIPLTITNILEGKKAPVYGDGLYVRDWLYVEDHCRAIELVLQKGKIGETYCVGGLAEDINELPRGKPRGIPAKGEESSFLAPPEAGGENNLTVVKKVLAILGKGEEMIEFVKDRPGHDRRYALDWSKIKQELGWQPLHDFDQWLSATVLWYKENQNWWKKLKHEQH